MGQRAWRGGERGGAACVRVADFTLSAAPGGEVGPPAPSVSADCPLSLDRRGGAGVSEKDQKGSSAPGAPRGLGVSGRPQG